MHPLKQIADLRPTAPWSVFSVPVYRTLNSIEGRATVEHRFAILWDEDNDERVLGAVLAFYNAAPREFRFCHAFGEHKGLLTAWQLGFHDSVESTLSKAIRGSAALCGDEWPIELIHNYLPSPTASDIQRATMWLAAAKHSLPPRPTLDEIAGSNWSLAADFYMNDPPCIDPALAAIHQLYELGSFGTVQRPWSDVP